MKPGKRHLQREFFTMQRMVDIYCEAHHAGPDAPRCDDCREFLDYAERRLDKCPYGDAKPTCANCPIHCYKPERREQVKVIMRYAGPRMLVRHPWLAIMHKLDGLRRALHPKTLSREQRLRSRDE